MNMLLGLSNSEEIDTSKFATKEELQQAVTDLQPVDEVAVDNMHSVTSNAVANAFKLSPIETISITTSNQTAQYDGYLFIYVLGDTETNIEINNENLAILQSPPYYDQTIVMPISKGDTYRVNNTTSIYWCKARWYKQRYN